ncbi:MAG: YidE/YbjL duplication [Sulfurospirillaceae bacterium]|nr:YidE/YbjL duplication [Sulfurospirillaceae bacterium]
MIHNEIFYLFSIISVGYIFGNIKIKGFSLDITAMLIVALIAGHYGMVISDDFSLFGLAIFIYAIGLQSGPGFFETMKYDGIKLNLIAMVLLAIIFLSTLALGKIFALPSNLVEGIFTGSLTSVTSLAAALEIKNDPIIPVIFGIVYPFGLIATVLFIRILPLLFRINIEKEVEDYESSQKARYPEIYTKNFKITNENFKNASIKKSQIEAMTSTVIERTNAAKTNELEVEDVILRYNDVVRVTGTKKQMSNLNIVLGEEVEQELQFNDNMKVLRLLTTSKDVVGKKIGTIKELKALRGVITKVRRAGIDIQAHPNLTLRLGDKLYVVAPEIYSEKVTKIIGNDLLKYPAADFLPISLGIVMGILLGSIPFDVPFVGVIKLSFVGGILVVALVLGRLGRVGPIVWNLSPHSTTLLKTLGQLMFVATVGTNAGKYLMEALEKNGFMPIYIALATLICSLLIVALTCRFILKMNFINIMGLLSGAMTSTPSLTMSNDLTKTDYPSIAYAAVYPMSLVLIILLAQFGMKIF